MVLCVQAEPEVMQRLMGVPRIADSIRSHYGTAPNPEALTPAAGTVNALNMGRDAHSSSPML